VDNVITEEVLERIAKDLATVTGLTFAVNFEKTTKEWQ
jgi:hypothetical protein